MNNTTIAYAGVIGRTYYKLAPRSKTRVRLAFDEAEKVAPAGRAQKVIEYLRDRLSPTELAAVREALAEIGEDAEGIENPNGQRAGRLGGALDSFPNFDRLKISSLGGIAAEYHARPVEVAPMSRAEEEAYLALFPNALRLR